MPLPFLEQVLYFCKFIHPPPPRTRSQVRAEAPCRLGTPLLPGPVLDLAGELGGGEPFLSEGCPGSPRAPLGSSCSRGAHQSIIWEERHRAERASAFSRSPSAAPTPAWLLAPGHCGRTKLTHTTIPRQSPLSPFFLIIVMITFQTLQLLGLVISAEAFGQSSWEPPVPPLHPLRPPRPSFTAVSLTKYIKPIRVG